jgi:hypothetical protein
LASDLIKTSNNTLCNAQNTFSYIYSGTPQGVNPSWSGVNNFQTYANQIAINFPNAVPTINTIFNTPNSYFAAAVALYAPATAPFGCPTLISVVPCPFVNTNNCPQATTDQIPVFSQNYCNSSISTSAAGLIANEQKINSTVWYESLMSLSNSLSSTSTASLSFSSLMNSASTLDSSIQNF